MDRPLSVREYVRNSFPLTPMTVDVAPSHVIASVLELVQTDTDPEHVARRVMLTARDLTFAVDCLPADQRPSGWSW